MNKTPPAAISQTSLPSQTGPIAASTVRRSLVGAGDEAMHNAGAEVEAVQHDIGGEHRRDDREPDRFHHNVLVSGLRATIDFLQNLGDKEKSQQQIQPRKAQQGEDHVTVIDLL